MASSAPPTRTPPDFSALLPYMTPLKEAIVQALNTFNVVYDGEWISPPNSPIAHRRFHIGTKQYRITATVRRDNKFGIMLFKMENTNFTAQLMDALTNINQAAITPILQAHLS